MMPIRPINEELYRLHLPIVSAEVDDTSFQGFSVTSMMSNSRNTHSTRRGSTSSRPEAIRRGSQRHSSGSSGPTPPLYPRPCCRHAHTLSNGSSIASGGYNNNTTVLYPVANTVERLPSHQHPYAYQHHPYQEEPRHYVHTTSKTIYTSPSGAPSKGRSW